MLKKLCATGLLVLALLPFTAPFQTFDFTVLVGSLNDGAALVAPTTATSPSIADDAGSLVAPLAARLRGAPLSEVVIFTFVAPRTGTLLASSVASIGVTSGEASPPTPLRL
jgi:hypothetical protein